MKLCNLCGIATWANSTISGHKVSTVYPTYLSQFSPRKYQGVPLFQRQVPKRLSWIHDYSSNNWLVDTNRKDSAEEAPHHRVRRRGNAWMPDHNVEHAKSLELPEAFLDDVPFPTTGYITDISSGATCDAYDATIPNQTTIATVSNMNNRNYGQFAWLSQIVVAVCPPYQDAVYVWSSPGVTTTFVNGQMTATWRASTGREPIDLYWNSHYAGTSALAMYFGPWSQTLTQADYMGYVETVSPVGQTIARDLTEYITAHEYTPRAAEFEEAYVSGKELDLQFSFELGETGDYAGYSLTIPEAVNTRISLEQHAFKNAVDNIAHTWGNGLQNIAAIVASIIFLRKHAFQSAEITNFTVGSDIRTLRTDYTSWARRTTTRKFRYSWKKTWLSLDNIMTGMPREWRGMWLQYRYILMTSLLDSEELFNKRLTKNDAYSLKRIQSGEWNRSYGIAHATVKDIDFTCRCRLRFRYKPFGQGLDRLGLTLEDLSLVPDLYVIWDFIPYSFVVDWFVPYGDIFEMVDTNKKLEENFEVRDVLYSLKYTHEWSGLQVTNYSRYSAIAPSLNGLYWFSDGTSGKTMGKRLVDTAALFL